MKILYIVNGLYSHYLPCSILAQYLKGHETDFITLNGFQEDEAMIQTEAVAQGWHASTIPELASHASKRDDISNTFTPPYGQIRTQVAALCKVLEARQPDVVIVEAYSTIAATATELAGCKMVVLNLFCLEPRVSYNGGALEKTKNMAVSMRELSVINSYRALHLLRPIGWTGVHSNYANVFPCPPGYANLRRFTKSDYFIGPLVKDERPIPAGLKQFMKKGDVVSVCLGTSVHDSDTLRAIVASLATLPYNFVIGLGQHELEVRHKNVFAAKWVPLDRIASQTLASVNHGGLNTTLTAVRYRNPMVVIPFFGDQFATADRITKLGFGTKLRLSEIANVGSALKDVIERRKAIKENYQCFYDVSERADYHTLNDLLEKLAQ